MALHLAIELVMRTALKHLPSTRCGFPGTTLHRRKHLQRSVYHFESPRTEYQLFHQRSKKAHRFVVEHKVLQPLLLHEVSMVTTEVID